MQSLLLQMYMCCKIWFSLQLIEFIEWSKLCSIITPMLLINPQSQLWQSFMVKCNGKCIPYVSKPYQEISSRVFFQSLSYRGMKMTSQQKCKGWSDFPASVVPASSCSPLFRPFWFQLLLGSHHHHHWHLLYAQK